MEYDDEGNDATGNIPEFGAIFMSNTETIEECLSREVFALPYSCAHFVKQVKAGMALFLFEFDKRQLFGVYQASSDGEMDIVPHGFNYSGKRFPAQVRVKPLWHCSPLSENEFRDAIIENYFSAKRFNFGLSEDQVQRLLHLFSARKLKNTQPTLVASNERLRSVDDITARNQRRFTGSSNERLQEGDEISTRYHGRFAGSTQPDEFKPVILHPYQGKSSGRYDEQGLMLENGFDADDKYCHCSQDHVTDHHSPARRRITHGVIITDEIGGNEAYNHIDSVISSDHLRVSPDMRSNAGDRFTQRNRSFEECNKSNDPVQAYERVHYREPRDQINCPTSDHRFFLDDGVGRESGARDFDGPIIYGENHNKLPAQARVSTSNSPSSNNEKSKDGYDMYYRNSPLLDIDQSGTHLHRASKTSAIGGRSSFDDGIETKDEFGGFPVANFRCGNSARELPQDYRIHHDRELLSEEGRASGNMFGTIRGSPALNESYGQQVDHMHMGKKREVLETSQDLHTYVSPPVSTELPYVSMAKQNLIPFPEQGPREIEHSQLRISRNIDQSLSNFDDALIIRAIPYMHEWAKSVSAAADSVGAFKRKDHSHNGSPLNFYTSSNTSGLSEYNLSSKYGGQYAMNRSNRQTTTPPTSSNMLMQREPNACGPVDYSGSHHRDSHLPYVPCTIHDMVEGRKESSSHLLKSREHQFAIDGCLLREPPQYRVGHTIQPEMDNSVSRDLVHQAKAHHTGDHLRPRERNLSSDYNRGAANAKRRSVFSRLSFGPKVKASAKAADTHFNNCQDRFVGASADEVMEMLQQINHNNMAPKNLRSLKAIGKRRDERGDMREKVSHGLKEKLQDDEDHTLPYGDNIISEETPILGFKRRSEAKKNLVSARSDSTTAVNKCAAVDEATETSTTKVPPKRRKLIRPFFGKE